MTFEWVKRRCNSNLYTNVGQTLEVGGLLGASPRVGCTGDGLGPHAEQGIGAVPQHIAVVLHLTVCLTKWPLEHLAWRL